MRNQADFPVHALCRVLKVARRADDACRPLNRRTLANAALIERIRVIGLRGGCRRRSFVVTPQRAPRPRPAPDLVKRVLAAYEPNQRGVADATFIPTWAGLIYLAIVLEVLSRRVVGRSMGESLATE